MRLFRLPDGAPGATAADRANALLGAPFDLAPAQPAASLPFAFFGGDYFTGSYFQPSYFPGAVAGITGLPTLTTTRAAHPWLPPSSQRRRQGRRGR